MFQQDVGKSFYIPVIDIIQQLKVVRMWVICCSVKTLRCNSYLFPHVCYESLLQIAEIGEGQLAASVTQFGLTQAEIKMSPPKQSARVEPAALTVCSFVRIRKELHSTENSLHGAAWEERIPVHTSVTSGCKLNDSLFLAWLGTLRHTCISSHEQNGKFNLLCSFNWFKNTFYGHTEESAQEKNK